MSKKKDLSETVEDEPKGNTSLLQVIGSVLMAGLGVQSSKNKERDFKQGNFKSFIIVGIVFTVLFVVAVATVVSTVLDSAGK
jgi:heme/copper-type cytochrome/quinol oxidase subunit 4